jgi:hypothetical protein
MRYEVCDICGKTFHGSPINGHGSYEYIKHTNFSNNIRIIFGRTDKLEGDSRVSAMLKEFVELVEDIRNLPEFFECLRHYKPKEEDRKYLDELLERIESTVQRLESYKFMKKYMRK